VIPLAVPNLSGREATYLQECIASTFVSSVGPFVDRFEEQVAAAVGLTSCVAVSAGTTGLHLALHTVDVRPGDLVVLPSLTFIASANAIAHCGASPWLFDVSASSATLDPEQLTTTLHERLDRRSDGAVDRITGRRVAAILPVHTLGHPADMDPIVEVAEAYRIPVVADAAAALGATYRGRPIGRTGAAISVFSFNGNKTVTAGGGGALVSDDEALLSRARHLSTTARVGRDYDHDEVGFNYRMTNLQAAVGAAQMEQLETFVASKRRIQRFYADRLGHHPSVAALPRSSWSDSACWFAGLLLEGLTPDQVDEVRTALRNDGIDARPFWKPMHLQRPFAHAPCEPTPVTDRLWPRVLTLPCSTGITDDELEQVADATDRALKRWTA
jgi:perosamine synthetase